MRELLLLRHAKSRWDEPGKADHDRGLAPRGIEAARHMGRLILERGWLPDFILCSTAARAKATLDIVRQAWPTATSITTREEAGLYLAEPGRLLEICRRQDDARRRLLVIGHNPGMETLIQRLAGSGEPGLLAEVRTKLPTAALARLIFTTPHWTELAWDRGHLASLDTPKKLGLR